MESEGFKAQDNSGDLFDINAVDALSIGNNWHIIQPGTLSFDLDSEGSWWASGTLVPNPNVSDTPTHNAWFPLYEITGYRVAQS